MPKIKTRDGTEIYVKVQGSGQPVVLIHGWPLQADSFDDQALALADAGFMAVSYDRRGFGRSDQPAGGYDYDTFSDDLADVIAALNLSNIVLCGFSMGAAKSPATCPGIMAKECGSRGRARHLHLLGRALSPANR